ncbi:MAG: radical SAM protein, partial [Verrucomicrobiota bacterium]|nr:radical SAM protein [Verrucomicrobiota bacterium]
LLVGAGGAAFAKAHIKESLDFLKQCRLPQGNRVYLSPMENPETGTYGERSRRDGIRPLTHEEIHEQRQELVQELRAIGLQPVPYRVQPFAY